MSDNIPFELFLVILSRLPVAPLLRFRCVSKDWCRMIDNPYFIKIHLDRQTLKIRDSSNGVGHLLMVNRDHQSPRQLYSLSLNLLNYGSPLNFETIDPNLLELDNYHRPCLGSCNGLILVYGNEQRLWSIWNPVTRELHKLPLDCWSKIRKLDNIMRIVSGFGYDCGADDYKVLKHIQYRDHIERSFKYETCVYSLKSDSWKRIEDFPFRSLHGGLISSIGVFYNGALHWIRKRFHKDQIEFLIVAFDLAMEVCRSYPLPFLTLDGLKSPNLQLDELGGCLSMSLCYRKGNFETWLMNDYGVENSWTKLFSVEGWIFDYRSQNPRAISYSKSKGLILLSISNNELWWYDTKNNAIENVVSIPRNLNLYSSRVFVSSLVRIKRESMGKETEERG